MSDTQPKHLLHALSDRFDSAVVQAPNTSGSSTSFPQVDGRTVTYLATIGHMPWGNALCLIAHVLTAQGLDATTVYNVLHVLHPRFKHLFERFELQRMSEWHVASHLVPYLQGDVMPDDSQHMRYEFGKEYTSAARRLKHWLRSLPAADQERYAPFVLPLPDNFRAYDYISSRDIITEQQRKRKVETDAIVPHFRALRCEAHFRTNRMTRLYQAYKEALQLVVPDRSNLPLTFAYDEGGDVEGGIPPQERLEFRLWDRRSFVIAHADQYADETVRNARKKASSYTDAKNGLFVEYVGASRLHDGAAPQGLWFIELLQHDVLGKNPTEGSPTEISAKQAFLREWGYGDDDQAPVVPFSAGTAGLLGWSVSSGNGQFVSSAFKKTGAIIIPVESLYAACRFGLLAINMFTTTGMRMNEALQIRLGDDCVVKLSMPAPLGATDQTLRLRYVLRLIPKGERGDVPQNYFVAGESLSVMRKVYEMLIDHYGLGADELLPAVPFNARQGRSHRFGAAQYLFQFQRHHLGDSDIAACMRFLVHGMTFHTREGNLVILKSHLLRHAFATHALQVEQLPLDVVGIMLKQKNLEVTAYYSQPTESMIAEGVDLYLARVAARLDLSDAVHRGPPELQRQLAEAEGKVGTLTDVIGGQCTSHGFCTAKFACIGCPAKVPDPSKRAQVEHKQRWARENIIWATEEGLRPAAERMRQLDRDCELELQEMDQIEAYRRDETRRPTIWLDAHDSQDRLRGADRQYVCS